AELSLRDEHIEGDVRRSLLHVSDLSPHRVKADVFVTGHAATNAGVAVLRLAISAGRVVLDKTIRVFDARATSAHADVRVPLIYEEALGGAGSDANFAGSPTPRLFDPVNPNRPATFAPLPQSWPVRNRLLAGLDERTLGGTYVDLPPSIDWAFFQCAP